MPPLRTSCRPSILELTNFLLGPPLQYRTAARCQSRLLSSARASQIPIGLSNGHSSHRQCTHTITRSFTSITPRKSPSQSSPPKSSSATSSSTSTSSSLLKPTTHDRGPASSESTQTDFSVMDVLGNMPAPSTSIDACLYDGFHLNSGVKVGGGKGVMLLGGEAFAWCPWVGRMGNTKEDAAKDGGKGLSLVNEKGQWHVEDEVWGLLELVWPKPDLLILGLGPSMHPLSPQTRQYINSLGIRVDIQDTRNAAAQFNLLATERGTQSVAAALVPIGWREGRGVR